MDDSETEGNKPLEIFQFSPLQTKLQQSKPHLRLCQIKYLKSGKTPSPSQTNFKTSAFPRLYEGSYFDSKLNIKSSPSKLSIKSSRSSHSKRSHIFAISKSPSINHSKDITIHKSPKKAREDSFLLHLLHLSQIKTNHIKLKFDKSYKSP